MTKNHIARRLFLEKTSGFTLGLTLLPPAGILLSNRPAGPSSFSSINWEKTISSAALHWKKCPENMPEAPHFGNGLIGSMIWFEDQKIRLQVFRTDVHDHADHTYGWTAYSRPRYQIGYYIISTKGLIDSCSLVQDLYHAELRGKIITSQGEIIVRHFVHRHDDLIYTRLIFTKNESISSIVWHPFSAVSSRGGSPDSKTYGGHYAPYKKLQNPAPESDLKGTIKTCTQNLSAGGSFSTGWIEHHEEKSLTLLTTIQHTFPNKQAKRIALEVIQNGMQTIQKNLAQWKKQHRKWWHEYYPESFVHIKGFEGMKLYWGNVYRLACSTRPDAKYIDTPGMWNSGGPWPYSTHDFNTQTAHFPLYTANRLHLGEALVKSLKENKQNLIDNVTPEEWQQDSALLPLATAFDLRGKRDGDARYSQMVGCLPWLLNNVWLHYRYTMNREILRDPLFPLLKRSINLYRHLLYEGQDKKIHLTKTFSPELGEVSDCNFDLALIRWGCEKLIEICTILKINDPLHKEWQKILDHLVDYPVDQRGFRLGNERTAPKDHQHMSHLMMIYPLYLCNIDNTRNPNLLVKSLKNFNPPTALPKMAAAQSSPAAAALGLGNRAYQLMETIRTRESEHEKLGYNGIYYLATPCIETSLAYNTCIQDMLLQSWGGKIRLFPALPDEWQDVEFQNLRTEGAFLVSAIRKNGITRMVRLKSLAGEPCEIDTGMNQGILKLHLKKGEEQVWTHS